MEEEEEEPKGRNLLKLVREAAVFYTTIFFSLAAIFRYLHQFLFVTSTMIIRKKSLQCGHFRTLDVACGDETIREDLVWCEGWWWCSDNSEWDKNFMP